MEQDIIDLAEKLCEEIMTDHFEADYPIAWKLSDKIARYRAELASDSHWK